MRSGTRAQIGRSSSGTGATSSLGWLDVVLVLIDPVWRVRREWVVVVSGFLDTDAARWSVLGFLELTKEWLNAVAPEAGV